MTLDELKSHVQELNEAYKRQPSDELLNQIFQAQVELAQREQATSN